MPALLTPSPALHPRGLRVAYRDPVGGRAGVVVRVGERTTGYHLRAEADDMGWVVGWSREDGHGDYTVFVDADGRATRCDCPARCRCRHMAGTEVLIRKGVI